MEWGGSAGVKGGAQGLWTLRRGAFEQRRLEPPKGERGRRCGGEDGWCAVAASVYRKHVEEGGGGGGGGALPAATKRRDGELAGQTAHWVSLPSPRAGSRGKRGILTLAGSRAVGGAPTSPCAPRARGRIQTAAVGRRHTRPGGRRARDQRPACQSSGSRRVETLTNGLRISNLSQERRRAGGACIKEDGGVPRCIRVGPPAF